MSIKSSLPASQFELPLTNSETNSNLTYQNAELPASSVSTHPSDYTIVPRTSSPILENNQNDDNHNPENNSENNQNNDNNFLFSSLLPETGHLRSIQKDVDSVVSNVDQKIQSAKNLQQEARNLFPEKKKSSLIRNDSFTKDRRSIPPSEEELNDPFLQASMNRSTNLTDSDPTDNNDYEYIKPLKTIQMEFDGFPGKNQSNTIDVNLISLNSEEEDDNNNRSDATYSINSSYNGDDENYLQDLPEGPDFTENERCHTPTENYTDKNNNYEQCEIVPMKDNERVVQYLIKGVVVAVFFFHFFLSLFFQIKFKKEEMNLRLNRHSNLRSTNTNLEFHRS